MHELGYLVMDPLLTHYRLSAGLDTLVGTRFGRKHKDRLRRSIRTCDSTTASIATPSTAITFAPNKLRQVG